VKLRQGSCLACAAVLVVLTASNPARAEPNDYVLLPAVVQGERALELKLGSADGPGPRDSAGSVSLEYAPTDWWATEFYVQFHHSGPDRTGYDAVEWENRFQLTEPGQYAADWGMVLEIEKPRDPNEGWHVNAGPLIQGSFDSRWQWNFNPMIAQTWSGASPATTDLAYQAQLKYRYQPAFEVGVQGFGDLGPWYHWSAMDAQSHNLGPAVFGRWPMGGRQVLYYNMGWLFGLTSATPHNTLRAQIEFEF